MLGSLKSLSCSLLLARFTFQLLALSTLHLVTRFSCQLLAQSCCQLLPLSSWHRNCGSAERNKEVQRGAMPCDECSNFAVISRVDEWTGGWNVNRSLRCTRNECLFFVYCLVIDAKTRKGRHRIAQGVSPVFS